MNPIRTLSVTLFSIAVLIAAAGCNRTETPAQTQADVAKAERKGAENVADERREANKEMAHADNSKEASHEAAEGKREVAMAEAKAAHKVAIEKCEAMTGDARANCKKQADADYDSAKLHAESAYPAS